MYLLPVWRWLSLETRKLASGIIYTMKSCTESSSLQGAPPADSRSHPPTWLMWSSVQCPINNMFLSFYPSRWSSGSQESKAPPDVVIDSWGREGLLRDRLVNYWLTQDRSINKKKAYFPFVHTVTPETSDVFLCNDLHVSSVNKHFTYC